MAQGWPWDSQIAVKKDRKNVYIPTQEQRQQQRKKNYVCKAYFSYLLNTYFLE